jgi:hypothetical protein
MCERIAYFLNYKNIKKENCTLLGHYAAGSGNFLQTFRDNLSVPSSGFKNRNEILVYKSQQDAMLQSLFYLTTALHVSGVTITHHQEYKTVTTASGNRYTVIDRLKFTDKEYR